MPRQFKTHIPLQIIDKFNTLYFWRLLLRSVSISTDRVISYNVPSMSNSLFKDSLLLFQNQCPSLQENPQTVHHPTSKSICVLLFKVRGLSTAAVVTQCNFSSAPALCYAACSSTQAHSVDVHNCNTSQLRTGSHN